MTAAEDSARHGMDRSMRLNSERDAIVEAVVEQAVPAVVDAIKETMDDRMAHIVAQGFVAGLRSVMRDEENRDIVEKFWGTGYTHLTTQAGNKASTWVGKRVLVALVGAVFIYTITWLVRNGSLK